MIAHFFLQDRSEVTVNIVSQQTSSGESRISSPIFSKKALKEIIFIVNSFEGDRFSFVVDIAVFYMCMAGPAKITVVFRTALYAKSDRKRNCITGINWIIPISSLETLGLKNIHIVEPHSEIIYYEHTNIWKSFIMEMESEVDVYSQIISPDKSMVAVIDSFSLLLNAEFCIILKYRLADGQIKTCAIRSRQLSKLDGRFLIMDDMIDSGLTIRNALLTARVQKATVVAPHVNLASKFPFFRR